LAVTWTPFARLAEFALGRLKQSAVTQFLRFLFALGFSGTLSFLFVCGVSLTAGESPAISIGRGMVASAVCMTICYRTYKSKLLAGLPIVLPAEEAKIELQTNTQTIERN
jgi:hypothetical protein